jgi:hypothetical protein
MAYFSERDNVQREIGDKGRRNMRVDLVFEHGSKAGAVGGIQKLQVML